MGHPPLTWSDGELSLNCCRVMAVLNVTPDSFSDGGRFLEAKTAIQRSWRAVEEGADILDVGAESTRPGAPAVPVDEERRRLWPVLRELKDSKFPLPISLDSRKPEIACEAIEAGLAQILNDVEGLRNPKMVEVVKSTKAPIIVMHMFGTPDTMQTAYHYDDVVQDLIAFFRTRLAQAGVTQNVVIDPGIGFGKGVEHNLAILNRLREFEVLGHPILIGASRKSFIGKVLNLEVDDRLEGSLAAAAIAIYNGASIVRVHDVRETVRVARMAEAIRKQIVGH